MGVSRRFRNIRDKIKEVDDFIMPERQATIGEARPELVFLKPSNGVHLKPRQSARGRLVDLDRRDFRKPRRPITWSPATWLDGLQIPLADNLPSEYRPHRIEAEGGASCVLHGASLQSDIRDRGADVAQGPLERLREEQRMAACGSAAQVDRFGTGFRRMNGGAACAHSLFKNDLLVASYCAPDVGDRLPEMGARRLCQRLRLGDGIMRERLVPECGAAG
jgi:hypothetical protein